MSSETKNKTEGLLKLLLADGLPPNIKMIRVPVRENWEGKLVLDKNKSPFLEPLPEPTPEEARAMNLQKEDIELEEYDIEGRRLLAGFSQLEYSLVVGWLE